MSAMQMFIHHMYQVDTVLLCINAHQSAHTVHWAPRLPVTRNTFNGAEAYNNKFNDIINTLQQQGHSLTPHILKSVYLVNIQDRTYEHIRDQASTDVKTTLSGVQSAILQKYLSVIGERRRDAPPYTNKRFVNNMNSNQRVHFDPNDTVYEFDEDARENDYVNSTLPASIVREIFAASGSRPKSDSGSSTQSPSFPLIPKELYESLPDEVKLITRQQHAYYLEKYGRGGGNLRSARCSSTSNMRSINSTTTDSCPEDHYTSSSDETQEFHDPLNEDTQKNDSEEDPVLTTFQQFFSQVYIKIFVIPLDCTTS